MKILSLFDGMSCGRLALERSGIPVSQYYASEIDKHAMKISNKNYPDIIQLGDVVGVRKMAEAGVLGHIDLLIGGSPCQGFSFAGKQLAFDDPRSVLFFEYIKILVALRKTNPDIKFMLENVRMKKEHLNIITLTLGVEPVFINSALVSAQNRQRYYWANWDFKEPEDKGILLKDIIHESVDEWVDRKKAYCIDANYYKGANVKQYLTKCRRQQVFVNLQEFIVPFDKTLKILEKEVERGKIGYFRQDSQANRVYYIHNKAVCLCGDAGGGAAKMGMYLMGCITPDRINKRQNGQRFNDGQKFYTLTAQDQRGILIEGYIRKLTPIECERLQTVPDNYTDGVSNTQRYKMLGNGWTVDVIAHIFEGLKTW